MHDSDVKNYLVKKLDFKEEDISKLEIYVKELLLFNKKYNLISKNTEKTVWHRHILDSAQLVKFINFNEQGSLIDLGTGAGLPGIVLSIFNKNNKFHVKLYEKSNVKCMFLVSIKKKLKIDFKIYDNDYHYHDIDGDYVVCRAFKKLPKILAISREKIKKPHKLIILKGKDAQDQIKNAFKGHKHKYRLEESITNKESKIVIAKS